MTKSDPKSELVDPDQQLNRFNDYFAGLQKRQEDAAAPLPKTSNLDGLDLELSQSTKHFDQLLAQ